MASLLGDLFGAMSGKTAPLQLGSGGVSTDALKMRELQAQNKDLKNQLEAVMKGSKQDVKEVFEQFAGSAARWKGVAASAVGGAGYGAYSNFVLETICKGNSESYWYVYRWALAPIALIFGDKVLPRVLVNDPTFLDFCKGMVAAGVADALTKRNLDKAAKELTPAQAPATVKGFDDVGAQDDIAAVAEELRECSGNDYLGDACESGAIPMRIARRIVRRYKAQGQTAGDEYAGEALESALTDGAESESGARRRRLSKTDKAAQDAEKALKRLYAKQGVPPSIKKKDETIAKLRADLARERQQGKQASQPEVIETDLEYPEEESVEGPALSQAMKALYAALRQADKEAQQ